MVGCRFQRGLKRKPLALIKKLRKAKKDAAGGEKPEPVRTHLRNMIIVPEMIGSIIGVYNGKTFNQVGITIASQSSSPGYALALWPEAPVTFSVLWTIQPRSAHAW